MDNSKEISLKVQPVVVTVSLFLIIVFLIIGGMWWVISISNIDNSNKTSTLKIDKVNSFGISKEISKNNYENSNRH